MHVFFTINDKTKLVTIPGRHSAIVVVGRPRLWSDLPRGTRRVAAWLRHNLHHRQGRPEVEEMSGGQIDITQRWPQITKPSVGSSIMDPFLFSTMILTSLSKGQDLTLKKPLTSSLNCCGNGKASHRNKKAHQICFQVFVHVELKFLKCHGRKYFGADRAS